MKKLLNILYITTENSRVRKENETLVVEAGEKKLGQFPIHMFQGLMVFGPIWISPYAMAFCAERGVSISFFSEFGKFLARVEGPVSGNILLRKEQYRISDLTERSVLIAKAIVAAKIANSRSVLQRHLRNYSECDSKELLKGTVLRMGRMQEQSGMEFDLDRLRGIEGAAADEYFSCFNNLITCQKEDFLFKTRSRRPPLDRLNAMLSFVYSLITHDCRSALEGVGLDPQAGFLHRDRPGRPSLALDLVEEFRAVLGDRLVLSLINLKQVGSEGFKISETGAVQIDDKVRREILVAWQEKKKEELIHPFLGEKAPIGIVIHLQALLLARTIRGDLNHYPAFLSK